METDAGGWIFGILSALMICGAIGWFIGDGRGRGGWGFWLGCLFGPVGIIIVLLMGERKELRHDLPIRIQSRPQRKCPFCAELVLSEAVICRFCQRDLPPALIPDRDPIFRTAAR